MNAEELEKLHNLRKRGIITEEEFNSQKNSLLNKKRQSIFLWLALLLGGLGIHNFYVGQTIRGIFKLILFILSLAFPILDLLYIGIFIWIIIEMCITDKTAAGVSLIPASTACKIAIGIIMGIYIFFVLILIMVVVGIAGLAGLAGYMAALQ